MTYDEIKERLESIKARRDEIKAEANQNDADLDALLAELNTLEEEEQALVEQEEELRAKEAGARETRAKIARGVLGKTREKGKAEKAPDETRNSKEYVDAFADYIKTGDPRKCRALLTTNVSTGTVPVPDIVQGYVETAWENNEILSRVRRVYVRGNLRVPFEISATGAVVHVEGTDAPTEEELVLGIVEMIPQNIKKWITISDEVMAMGGEEFLRYIFDEVTQKIARELVRLIITDIVSLPQAATPTSPAAAKITQAPGVTTVGAAFANLSDEARDVVVIMNKLTYADFLAARAAASFAIDPFEGLTVLYDSTLPAYSTAAAGAVYMIVGDLDAERVNFPEGDDTVIKFDELSLAEKDLVKVVGRQYVAHAVTASGAFTLVAKPA